MKYSGKIENLDHIVLSDPMYKDNVWCRYEKKNMKEKDWYVDLEIDHIKHKIGKNEYGEYQFFIILKNNEDICRFEDDEYVYDKDIKVNRYEIGMDSACVALGINEKAKEIKNSYDDWQPYCALRTGGDGIFGGVIEGVKNGKVCFIAIDGELSDDMISENELYDYLIEQFDIKEIEIIYDKKYDNNPDLNIKDIVEVYQCAVKNDNDKYIDIRNYRYKSDVEGKILLEIKPDGSKVANKIEAHDKLVNNPIKIEVVDSWFDYETGNHYEGNILNNELIEEIKKISKDDSDINRVTFSEFDVVKKLDNEKVLEMDT